MDELEGAEQLGGRGTLRQCSARRFRVRIRIEAASRSMSIGRTARASETRVPVRASVRAKVWSAGRGARRAASRKRWRSSAIR